jgi:hypothetical protein
MTRNLSLIDAIQLAGNNGVIARRHNPNDVILVRTYDFMTSKGVMIQVTDHDIGNWFPTEADKVAQDWFVVASARLGLHSL